MKPEYLENRNSFEECPKCGKHSLAQQSQDKYRCLWCGFYRDFSKTEGTGMFLITAMIIVFLLATLSNQNGSPNPEMNSPDSANISELENENILITGASQYVFIVSIPCRS